MNGEEKLRSKKESTSPPGQNFPSTKKGEGNRHGENGEVIEREITGKKTLLRAKEKNSSRSKKKHGRITRERSKRLTRKRAERRVSVTVQHGN